MYIYIDVLIVTSVYIDFLLIKASAAVIHRKLRSSSCIVGALAGSLFSLTVLLPPMGTAAAFLLRLASAAVIVYAAFGFVSLREFLFDSAVFFTVSCLFAGICVLVSQFSDKRIIMRNGSVYFDISLTVLIVSTAAAYGAALLIRRFSSSAEVTGIFTVTVRAAEDKIFSFEAVPDTGNFLADPITGLPVIVCPADKLTPVTGGKDLTVCSGVLPRGWRLIPFGTAAGSGIMPVYRPDGIYISREDNGRKIQVDAYIGISLFPSEKALFNPKMIYSPLLISENMILRRQ